MEVFVTVDKMIKVSFQVSQGSAATYLRCGKHDRGFIANFLSNLTVKNYDKKVSKSR